jgi:hypothetical protein
MNLESQVTSPEISNKIRKLLDAINVQKFSIFFRDSTQSKAHEIGIWTGMRPDWCEDNIPCYTDAELDEIMPCHVITRKSIKDCCDFGNIAAGYTSELKNPHTHYSHAITGANARGLMLIHLLENKLIPLSNLK